MSGNQIETRHRRSRAPHCNGVLSPSVSETTIPVPIGNGLVVSPYFKLDSTVRQLKVGTDGFRQLNFITMSSRIGIIQGYELDGTNMRVLLASYDDTSPFAGHGTDSIPFALNGASTEEQILALAKTAGSDFGTANGFTLSKIFGAFQTADDQVHAYEGISFRSHAFSVVKSATVGSGVAVFHLTEDGLSTGASLFPNGVIKDSTNVMVSDATASYQMSYAFSNSDKTVTVTTNKLTTANILTGLLGQTAANGSVVKLQVFGY